MTNKIGLLLPKSSIYPTINFDMMAGLRLSLHEAGIEGVEIVTESIGVGGHNKQIYNICEKLLIGGCRIIAAYINPTTAENLEPLFEAGNGILISLDAGYHYRSTHQKLNHVFFLSLQGALGSRMITNKAIEDGNKRIAYAGSFYEAGYRSAYACHCAIVSGEGQMTFNYVTKLSRREFSLEPLTTFLGDNNATDAVFASFCGDMLQDFCTSAANETVLKNKQVYGAPFVGDEQWLQQSPYPGFDIKVCMPWVKELDNPENAQFKSVVGKENNVNFFSLLGWEAGIVAAAALVAIKTKDAVEKLEGFRFDSPRGAIMLDAETHECHAPMYDAVVVKDDIAGNCNIRITGISEQTDTQRQLLFNDIRTVVGGFSSWFNAYGCLES